MIEAEEDNGGLPITVTTEGYIANDRLRSVAKKGHDFFSTVLLSPDKATRFFASRLEISPIGLAEQPRFSFVPRRRLYAPRGASLSCLSYHP